MSVLAARRLCAATSIAACFHASAAVYTVGPPATNPTHLTIQAAIAAALDHPGDDEIRVHTGTYNENLVITASMNADTLTISGGWGNGYVIPVRNGAALTVIDPPDGTRAVDFSPSGGLLQLEAVTISGAKATSCAGFLLSPSGGAQAAIAYSFVTDNLVDSAGTGVAEGGGGCLAPSGSAIALVYASTIAHNTARVSGATAGAIGGGVFVYCTSQAQCAVENSVVAGNRVEPNGDQAGGAGVYASVKDTALFVVSATELRDQEVGGTPTSTFGVGVDVGTSGSAMAEITRSRFRGSAVLAGTNAQELSIQSAGTSKAFVDNSVFAQSPLRALLAQSFDDSALSLLQLTLADNALPAQVNGGGTVAALVYDNILNGADATAAFDGLVATQHNLIGTDPLFVAPSLFDYSLRGASSPALNAGSDTLPVGTLDAAGAERVQDGLVDIGAYENSDRVFATRFDD